MQRSTAPLNFANIKQLFPFAQKESFKIHKMSVHEGLKYPCNQCTSEFTRKDNLKEHKKSVHENVKYSCNQCKSKFTQNGKLIIHK